MRLQAGLIQQRTIFSENFGLGDQNFGGSINVAASTNVAIHSNQRTHACRNGSRFNLKHCLHCLEEHAPRPMPDLILNIALRSMPPDPCQI